MTALYTLAMRTKGTKCLECGHGVRKRRSSASRRTDDDDDKKKATRKSWKGKKKKYIRYTQGRNGRKIDDVLVHIYISYLHSPGCSHWPLMGWQPGLQIAVGFVQQQSDEGRSSVWKNKVMEDFEEGKYIYIYIHT